MHNVPKWLQQKLENRQQQGNFRCLKIKSGLIDFSSNDYLGLARSSLLRERIAEATLREGLLNGSTGSRLLTGNQPIHQQVEEHLARFFQSPAALLFNSGYSANLALLSSLPQRGDTVVYDQSIHACVKDGARLGNAKCLSFRHNDSRDLERKLGNANGNKFVVIESLYSMDGDYPPIKSIIDICNDGGALLIVDEAHTTGWAGRDGSGWTINEDIHNSVLARVHTFGKGLGVQGACIVGSNELIDYVINFARPFIFTTAMAPREAVSIDCAISLLEKGVPEKEYLFNSIETYLQAASKLDVPKSLNGHSPIQWIMTPGNQKALSTSNYLQSSGFDVRPILSPTVPEGKERLRICLHSFNTETEILDLIQAIKHLP
jgi:8-amino-7-oxononanoate synthase